MEHAAVPGMTPEEKLSQWIRVYSDDILRICFLYLSDRMQAEDALQDTWIKAWRHMGEYERKNILNDKAWLMRIAINTCRDYRRTAWFRHIDKRRALEELPPRLNQTAEDDRSLSLAVMELPDRYKQVVLLYYFQGMTQRETAEALGLSPAAVLRRLRSAEALLKEALTGGEEA
ncbi:MAG: sigma-70 family RNA polymerase sigma factor [Clostridia bacterium]|nr:sigma-70 family RNA polymerase sigma factor [Clostridiales bacterium]MBQ2976453.1 sigma-70 family RNA polymerase sigma factor [Clostridia bacterium]MBQ6804955.1 sigma-70 family RNA polymerase sigma factor [Clostridia bacterium]